jgi:hypothetical protein
MTFNASKIALIPALALHSANASPNMNANVSPPPP